MSAQMDTTSKLSYLLPTGTFLTFQVLAPLATNNGHCGRTEQILTAVTLALLVIGCIAASFTDSFVDQDRALHYGFITCKGLWVPGFGTGLRCPFPTKEEASPDKKGDDVIHEEDIHGDFVDKKMFKPRPTDYINAALSAIAFLTLTMFTDPVSSCFYPHLSQTMLKTLPVLLATVLSFCCSFASKVRNGYGNPVPGEKKKDCPNTNGTHDKTKETPKKDGPNTPANANTNGTHDVTKEHRADDAV